jgi:tripartite-type tricarboxylate transporter receptor subunit TctC
MKLPRRDFLHLAAVAAALPVVPRIAFAQAYPSRPVRIIAGYPPGGSIDIHARLIGQWLSQRLGQPFVVENRPGAGGNVGSEAAAHAAPDGYTLLMSGIGNTISATLYDKLNYDFIRDFAPVAGVMRAANVIDVHPSVPVNSVPELIAYAKANPGKVTMGSSGVGTSPHLSGEPFKLMTGVDMLHVPYRGNAPRPDRSAGWAAAGAVRQHLLLDRAHQVRESARAGGDHRDQSAVAAGCSHGW